MLIVYPILCFSTDLQYYKATLPLFTGWNFHSADGSTADISNR